MNYARVELNNAGPVNYAAALRQEICARNAQWATRLHLGHVPSYGAAPVIVYAPDAEQRRHGNFLDASYRAILRRPDWAARLRKVHTTARRCLPSHPHGDRWRELDSCTSSDALLMNIFCYPKVLHRPALCALLGVGPGLDVEPEFGFRPSIPRLHGHIDRTEIDMRLGNLLVEAKLTEGDFQRAPLRRLSNYPQLGEIFDVERLPVANGSVHSWQLIRGVLAAHACGASFLVFCDRRRSDLIDHWFLVIGAVSSSALRTRLGLLTWQEIAATLPATLQKFLSEKYGI